jgi:4-amino-4-deoxy-L-arabinose transferase-like glycosyltransferase
VPSGFAEPSDRNFLSSKPKRYFLFLVVFGLFALLFNLGGRSLENKDSVNHPEIAREILELNDWIMLHQNGSIYVDKPPLHHWLTALSFKLFGVSTFSARLPEAIAAFCGIFIAFFFSKSIFRNSETAFLSGIILLATFGYLWWARRTRADIEFSVLFAMSLISFYHGVKTVSSKTKTLWYAAFWLSTGCAFMEKAFIAFANLAVVIPYVVMVALKPERHRVKPGLLVMTSPCFALIVLPWMLSLWQHPEFSNYWEILQRTEISTRTGGLFEYIVDLPMKLFPGTPFFLLGLWFSLRFRKHLAERPGLPFVWLWIGVYFFILHFTIVKDTRYLIPIYLPCSIVAAWAISLFSEKHSDLFSKIMRHADRIFLVLAALSLAVPFIFSYVHKISLLAPLPYVSVLGLALLLARKFLPLKTAAIFISFTILFLSFDAGDSVVDKKTATFRQISQILKLNSLSPEDIRIYNCLNSDKEQSAISFYYNRLIKCSDNLEELLISKKVKAIVAERKFVDREMPWEEVQNQGRVIPYDDQYFILLKSNSN